MSSLSIMRHFLLAALVLFAISNWETEARYLPTRSQDDRLERLRELIKDLLDTELEKPVNALANNDIYERKMLYKREAAAEGAAVASVGRGQIASSRPPH